MGQGGSPLTAQGQQPHQLLVRLFRPGFWFEQEVGAGNTRRIVALLDVVVDQPQQRPPRHLPEALPLIRHPLFKEGGVAHMKIFQKFAAVEGDGLGKLFKGWFAAA